MVTAEVGGPSDGWQRRRARISLQIERAALQLFATQPSDEVTVEQIAQAAGISKRTFFRYFATRDEVLAVMPNRQVDALCARVAARPAKETVLEAFIAAVQQGEGDDAARDDIVLLWATAIRRGAGLPQLDGRNGPQLKALTEVIAKREGLEVSDVRVQTWATAIAAVLGASFASWLETDGAGPSPKTIEEWFVALGEIGQGRRRPRRATS